MPNIYDFGRELIRTKDLDPVYVILWEAKLDRLDLHKWLLAYWCFYHSGTASWATDQPDYWKAMETAAASSDYPRCHERRHFRGNLANRSAAYLKGRGTVDLFHDLIVPEGKPKTVAQVMEIVKGWYGFGEWIAFKVADMLERLGLCPVRFDDGAIFLFKSPRQGAELLWRTEYPDAPIPLEVGPWAVSKILNQLTYQKAPPSEDRIINSQEAETILCKFHSYTRGHYQVGEDIRATRKGLAQFAKCRTSQKLLAAGKFGGLW